jgi:hypothetical protein
VVHEHATVDLGEIHNPLTTLRESVERSHHIVTIDAEIEREMVTCPRRHAHVRQPTLRSDRGDDRLRPVPAGAEPVGTVCDRVAHQRLEVVPEMQLHRLNAPSAGLTCDLEALRLTATRLRVIEQHRPLQGRVLRLSSFPKSAVLLRHVVACATML